MNRTGANRQAFINSLHKEDAIQLQVSYFIFLGLFRSGPNYTCQSFPLCFDILRCYESDVNEDFDLPDLDKKKTTSMRFCRRFVMLENLPIIPVDSKTYSRHQGNVYTNASYQCEYPSPTTVTVWQ